MLKKKKLKYVYTLSAKNPTYITISLAALGDRKIEKKKKHTRYILVTCPYFGANLSRTHYLTVNEQNMITTIQVLDV